MFKLFKKRVLTQAKQNAKILRIVEDTNKANPYGNRKFIAIAPKIHLCPRALEYVNCYGHLSKVYCASLVACYPKNFPFEIEKAIIELQRPNLIYYLTEAGHIWSTDAKDLMREKHSLPYQHNVLKKTQN